MVNVTMSPESANRTTGGDIVPATVLMVCDRVNEVSASDEGCSQRW
ncbi:MAG: hypothetical protein EBE86_033975 [Hormoscilla sp. GUM202]|nr:hypothetical protein [Hormoscilla sp. GUM202]